MAVAAFLVEVEPIPASVVLDMIMPWPVLSFFLPAELSLTVVD